MFFFIILKSKFHLMHTNLNIFTHKPVNFNVNKCFALFWRCFEMKAMTRLYAFEPIEAFHLLNALPFK